MQLETERLILRNYLMSDLEDYWEYLKMDSVGLELVGLHILIKKKQGKDCYMKQQIKINLHLF